MLVEVRKKIDCRLYGDEKLDLGRFTTAALNLHIIKISRICVELTTKKIEKLRIAFVYLH